MRQFFNISNSLLKRNLDEKLARKEAFSRCKFSPRIKKKNKQ